MIQGLKRGLTLNSGRVTASRVADVFTKPRKGSSVSKVREGYLADLLAERLTGRPSVPDYAYGEEAMAWGKQTEPFARAAYEAHTGNKIELVGFVEHPTVPIEWLSRDGLRG